MFSRIPQFASSLILAGALALPSSFTQAEVFTYQSSDASFANPERGLYSFVALLSSTRFDSLSKPNTSLVYTPLTLDQYINKPISASTLNTIRARFDELREAGLKAILRVNYNYHDTGTDATLANMITHMDQLAPIIEANKDVIPYIQAGYFGQWGEWHDWCRAQDNSDLTDDFCSKHLDNSSTWSAVLNNLLERTPDDRFVQIRYPRKKRAIFGNAPLNESTADNNSSIARVGHHNDCFLASTDDVGTFSDANMSIAQEKAYLGQEGKFTPTGGETCTPVNNTSRFQCDQALSELENQHWVYLNQDFYEGAFSTWRAEGCMTEISQRLGYRIELNSAEFPNPMPTGSSFTLKLSLKNSGFARPHYQRTAYLRIIKQGNVLASLPIPELDLHTLAPNEVVNISSQITLPEGLTTTGASIALWLPDADERNHDDERYAIRLAYAPFNNSWDGHNILATDIDISNNSPKPPNNLYIAN